MRAVRLIASLVALAAIGCGGSSERRAAADQEIRQTIARYVEAMSEAYREEDARRLAVAATPREVEGLARRLADLGGEGKRLVATLRELEFEAVDAYNSTNATVQTLERWDLRVEHGSTGELLSQAVGQRNRVAYHLVRDQGRWQVLSRQLRETLE